MAWGETAGGDGRARLLKTVLLVLVILLVAFLVFRQVQRMRGPTQDIWVAATDLAAGIELTGENLRRAARRVRDLPPDTIVERGAIEGRMLVRPKEEGDVFRVGDLARPPSRPGPYLSEILPEGRVLTTVEIPGLPIEDLAEGLQFGDRLDVLAVGNREARQDADFYYYGRLVAEVARDAFYIGWIGGEDPPPPSSEPDDSRGGLIADLLAAPAGLPDRGDDAPTPILLAVYPEDVLPLAQAAADRVRLSLVVHGKNEVDRGELLIFPKPTVSEVELIVGGRRNRIPVFE